MKNALLLSLFLLGFIFQANAITPAAGHVQENQFSVASTANSPGKHGLFKIRKMAKALRAYRGEVADSDNVAARVLVILSLGFIVAALLVLNYFIFGYFIALGFFGIGTALAFIGLGKNKKSARPSRLLKTLGIISAIINAICFLGLIALFVALLIVFGA